MQTNTYIAFWGCTICSVVWSANGNTTWAAIWLAVALLQLLFNRK